MAEWMRAADAIGKLLHLSGQFRRPDAPRDPAASPPAISQLGQQLETRLTGVVVAALKEAFDRDRARMELERAQIEAERQRAEEALRAELRRRALDRALDRTRTIAVMTIGVWMLSAILAAWMPGMRGGLSKWLMGGGWACALAGLACGFSAWQRLSSRDELVPSSARDAGPAIAESAMAGLLLAAIALCGAAVLAALR